MWTYDLSRSRLINLNKFSEVKVEQANEQHSYEYLLIAQTLPTTGIGRERIIIFQGTRAECVEAMQWVAVQASEPFVNLRGLSSTPKTND